MLRDLQRRLGQTRSPQVFIQKYSIFVLASLYQFPRSQKLKSEWRSFWGGIQDIWEYNESSMEKMWWRLSSIPHFNITLKFCAWWMCDHIKVQLGSHFNRQPNLIFWNLVTIVVPIVFVNKHTRPLPFVNNLATLHLLTDSICNLGCQ